MHREGHIGVTLAAFAPIALVLSVVGLAVVGIAGAVVAAGIAMLPDWDQRIPFVKHRGVTHTVRFALVVGIVFANVGLVLGAPSGVVPAVGLAVFGFVVGFVTIGSHIAADALTPMGVEPFGDGRRYSFDLVRAANPIGNYLLLVGGVALLVVGVVVGSVLGAVIGWT